MTLDFAELQGRFNRIADDPQASAAERFIIHEATIRQLNAVVASLRVNADLLLHGAVRRIVEGESSNG